MTWRTLPEDPEVYETLRRADTVGMFQVESRAQMASIAAELSDAFYDLVVQVAIIRPGPDCGQDDASVHAAAAGEGRGDLSASFAGAGAEADTGVPLFQEQLLRIAMTVANFTGAEAEELRRAVGMRRSWERMKIWRRSCARG